MGSVWAGAAGVPDVGGGAGGSSTSISLMTTGIGWPPSVSAQAGAELRAGIEGQDSARRQQPRVVDVVRRGDGLPRDRAAGTGDDALDRVAVLAQRQRCRTDTGGCAGTERCARAGRCASANDAPAPADAPAPNEADAPIPAFAPKLWLGPGPPAPDRVSGRATDRKSTRL